MRLQVIEAHDVTHGETAADTSITGTGAPYAATPPACPTPART
jgi:hypothetical protein